MESNKEQKIYELMLQVQKENKEFRKDFRDYSIESINRLDALETELVEVKGLLKGVANQFELSSKNKDEDIEKVSKRLSNVESDVYRILRN